MEHPSADEAAIVKQLAGVPLFASLNESDRLAAVRAARIMDFSPGTDITREKTVADEFFVLLSGEATVSVAAEDETIEVGLVKPGQTLGEFGALLHSPRTATVTAARPCRVLRFDHAALEALFGSNPRFGLALCREMAQRLKQALAEKNELQREVSPEKVVLEAPDITRMREYMVSYYATAIKNVLKQHRLVSDRRFPVYETSFTLAAQEQQKWIELFNGAGTTTPFTYHTVVGTMALMRVVGDLGVNFRNLMHLRSEMGIAREHQMVPDQSYRLASQIEDIVALRDDRVAVICASRVFDSRDFQIRSYRDFFVILNLDPEYIDLLRSTKNYGHRDALEFHYLAGRKPELTDADGFSRVTIDIPEDMGFSYGRVSGDLNLVHTTKLAARIFGHPRPFIQGLCTANFALRHLTEHYGVPQSLGITFAKRVFVGQQIELRHIRNRFEVCDLDGNLLAFGDFS